MRQIWKAGRTPKLYRALGRIALVCGPAYGMRFACSQIRWWTNYAQNKQEGKEQTGQPNKQSFRVSAHKFIRLHNEYV